LIHREQQNGNVRCFPRNVAICSAFLSRETHGCLKVEPFLPGGYSRPAEFIVKFLSISERSHPAECFLHNLEVGEMTRNTQRRVIGFRIRNELRLK